GIYFCYTISNIIQLYIEEKMIIHLNKNMDNIDIDNFEYSSITPAMYNDQQYGIPILQEAYVYFYNVDLIEEIGKDPDSLPETWEEFNEWAKAAKEEGLYMRDYGGEGSRS